MRNLPNEIVIAAYHSLYVEHDLHARCAIGDGDHRGRRCDGDRAQDLTVGGVQFHPESLMSLGGEVGLRIVENAFRLACRLIERKILAVNGAERARDPESRSFRTRRVLCPGMTIEKETQ
jgi:hypothetical protein